MSFWEWLLRLLRKPPGPVTDVWSKVLMQEIDVGWKVPVVRADGSPMPAAELASTEVSISTDGGKTFAVLVSVKPNETQVVKRAPAPDGNYVFRLVSVGTNGKRGKAVDKAVLVDTPAPGESTDITVTIL